MTSPWPWALEGSMLLEVKELCLNALRMQDRGELQPTHLAGTPFMPCVVTEAMIGWSLATILFKEPIVEPGPQEMSEAFEAFEAEGSTAGHGLQAF